MRRYLTLLTSLLVAIALPVSAGDLNAQLNQFFKARDAQHAAGMVVVVRTPKRTVASL